MSKSVKVAFNTGGILPSTLNRLPDTLQSYLDRTLEYLQDAYSSLPLSTQAYIESAVQYAYLDNVPQSALAGTTVLLLVTFLAVGMSGWGRNLWGGSNARFSPFGRSAHPPNVTDDDFSYITSEDLAHPGRAYDQGRAGAPSMAAEDDVLLIKNKGVTYPVKFPAYSIGDGKLQVRDVKERASVIMDLPAGRVLKLVYKGQLLTDDYKPCRDFGLKNHRLVFYSRSVVYTC